MKKQVLILLLLVMSTFAAQAQNDKADFKFGKSMEILLNVFRDVNLYYVDTVDSQKLLEDAAAGMLMRLDPYTEYLSPEDMTNFNAQTTGKYGGVGALIIQKGEWVEISKPFQNSPAAKMGLRAGDRILAIDGTDLRNETSAKVSGMLRGTPGSKFELHYRPLSDTLTTKTITIKRERIFQPSVSYFGIVSPGIGYIRLDSFIEESSAEMLKAIEKLSKQEQLQGLIIDLRNNGGGIVGEAVKMGSFFVPKGTEIVSLRGKVKNFNTIYVTPTAPIEQMLPLVILQNSASASASEILAGSLQDLDRAVIVGQRSFGKGLVQSPRPMGYGAYLKVTIAKYYIPSGRSIQALDYTHRNADGSVGHIPDSLIREFKTRAGRKVYNGGGIQPDVKLERETYSKFTSILVAYRFFEEFANTYTAHNPAVEVDKFVLTDQIYNQFIEYVRTRPIEYESGTSRALKELREWAVREKYDERIKAQLDAIDTQITDDKMAEMKINEAEIREALALNIIGNWHYDAGSIQYGLPDDKEVSQAIEVLKNRGQYREILATQDTERK